MKLDDNEYVLDKGKVMPVHKKPSRLESNKDVRRILLRHRVDLSQLAFSCHGRTVSFSGDLVKDGGRDFSASEIDMMVLEILGLNLGVLSDLKNWDINGGTISKREVKDKDE